jgi:hypothetical protein
VLDSGRNSLLQSIAPAELMATATPLPRTADLFLVELRRTVPAPNDLRHDYLVRLGGKGTELVCRFALPPGPGALKLQVVTPSPFTFEISSSSSSGERIPYGLDQNGVCRPSLPTGTPSEFAYENAFAHAEMLYGLGRWGEAGDAQELVLHMRPQGSHTEDAALAAILARGNFLDLQCFPPPGSLEPQPIEGLLAKKIDGYDDYVRFFPASDRAVEMTYRKARELEGCNHLEEAAALFKNVADRRPVHALSSQAKELYRHVQTEIARRDARRRRPPAAP